MPSASAPALPLKEAGLVAASEEERARLKKAFDIFDADGSGEIDTKELENVMIELGKEPKQWEVEDLMASADKDGNGQISFEEFAELMGKKVQTEKGETEETLAEVFRVFDLDGSGYIDRTELLTIFNSLQTNSFRAPPEAFVDALMKDADKNGDGKVDYNEFVKVMLDTNRAWSGQNE